MGFAIMEILHLYIEMALRFLTAKPSTYENDIYEMHADVKPFQW